MANQITDNRTNVDTAEAVTNWDDLAGSAAGTLDTEIFYQGNGSIGQFTTNSIAGLLFDAGSAQDWSNNVFYILINCGIVGLLATKANSGLTIRFCGATVTDWFEFKVGGSDNWPTAFSGGWVQFVVDVEATPSTTNGTPPATTAIRYVGMSAITAGTMPRMADNTWIDQIARLPDGSAGIIVEGRNGGATDWKWDDVISNADTGKWGTARRGPGGSVVLDTPVQFFIDDGSTHAFNDTNQVILWDDQEFAATDLYGLTVLGAATGTANFTAGIKTGSGDTATGAQGWTITAASGGVRWFFDGDAANIDNLDIYGCTFLHGGDFQLDDAAVECISTLFNDCTSARTDNSLFLRCTVVNANTGDGVPFITTDDLTDIKFCAFEFSDGHAVELTTPIVASQTSKGNKFTSYGADATNDAAIFNNAAGAVTISISDSGDTPTVRDGASASTTLIASVNVDVHVKDKALADLENVDVYIQRSVATALTSGAGNNAGDGDLVVTQTIEADQPASGFLSVLDRSLNTLFGYRYASHDGANTFTFPTTVSGAATSTGSGTSLISTTTNFLTADIEEGDTIRNTTDGSFAVVDEIVDADNITTTALQGGTDDTWQSGDGFSFHDLATTLVSGTDIVDAPLSRSQTDVNGDIPTLSYDSTQAPTAILLRFRSNSEATKYIPSDTTGTISATDGFTLDVTMDEDTEAT